MTGAEWWLFLVHHGRSSADVTRLESGREKDPAIGLKERRANMSLINCHDFGADARLITVSRQRCQNNAARACGQPVENMAHARHFRRRPRSGPPRHENKAPAG